MLYHSVDLHKEFLDNEGIKYLSSFLTNKDNFMTYLSCKCFVLLSRYENNLVNVYFIK